MIFKFKKIFQKYKKLLVKPLLFLVHCYDLKKNTSFWIFNYADDTLLNTIFKQKTIYQNNVNFN